MPAVVDDDDDEDEDDDDDDDVDMMLVFSKQTGDLEHRLLVVSHGLVVTSLERSAVETYDG